MISKPKVSILAVGVATVVTFVLSATYYAVLGEQLAEASEAAAAGDQPSLWKVAPELLRGLVVAAVVAGLASLGDVDEWTGSLLLGLALWIGFPVVLWMGAVIHEKSALKLAVIHAGDWLEKLLVVSVIVSVLQ